MRTLRVNVDPGQAGPMSVPPVLSERRCAPRYAPGDPQIYVGWWEGDTFRAENGTLLNVSQGGAAIAVDTELGSVDTVWLCILGPGRVAWIPARVVDRDGRMVRMQFAEPLSFELFQLLI